MDGYSRTGLASDLRLARDELRTIMEQLIPPDPGDPMTPEDMAQWLENTADFLRLIAKRVRSGQEE